jgi:hypothetical protein
MEVRRYIKLLLGNIRTLSLSLKVAHKKQEKQNRVTTRIHKTYFHIAQISSHIDLSVVLLLFCITDTNNLLSTDYVRVKIVGYNLKRIVDIFVIAMTPEVEENILMIIHHVVILTIVAYFSNVYYNAPLRGLD